ncbi:HEPN domain-containing protein [Microbispora maris]|uniref:HEPN domain-containing protein n=1 Tax=Microbispora maris TaxID=3144104 RepID=UPI003D154893
MANRWPPWEVTSLKVGLESLSNLVEKPADHNLSDEVHGWLCRLLVVRSCGYLEQATIEVCRSYLDGKSGGLVKSFAKSWLDKSRNPTPDNLQQLVGRFDNGLGEEFQEFLGQDDQRVYREIFFLVDRRNKIAHGLSESVGHKKAIQLKCVVYEVVDWFVLRLNPNR